MFFLEALADNLFCCLFQLPEAACIPWLVTPSSIFKMTRVAFSTLSVSDPPAYKVTYKDTCDYLGPTCIIQDNLPISTSLIYSHLQTPFCQVREHTHRLWGSGRGHFGGVSRVLFSLLTTRVNAAPRAVSTR